MPQYRSRETEQKWQKRWKEAKIYHVDFQDTSKPKYYNLVMFPYPSGDKLHIGHWYNYAPADSWGRYMRMKGHRVFQPMGYDAFGLPAENYAIKTGIHPDESTRKNTATMTEQLSRIGTMYDWSKTLDTSRPDYYKWTQWLFLQMFKNGLAYKKVAAVNYCPKDQTVLANEQAQDGYCERCGTQVIQKPLNQWFLKITNYAGRLIDGLDKLNWPEKTKLMQKNWIGRSEGAEVDFKIEGIDEKVRIFTTRPDTLFGATYMVLAPEHPLLEKIVTKEQQKAVEDYRTVVAKKTELQRTDLAKEKTGVFTGAYAVNPVNGEKIPIWIADYVLMTYGTGAIMAVPAHDERDGEFAEKFKLPIKEVVTENGVAMNSDFLDGLNMAEAKNKMVNWLEEKSLGKSITNYRLRDWLVSRQRYWGAPIPIVYDPEGNPHPVPDEHLPWLLPTDVEFKPKGESPLKQSKEFHERTEKIFGKGWIPEYDTMDTFVCSSFYYLRYLMPGAEGNDQQFIDPEREKNWMPVDMYIGGPEHACMHLIYARFVMMALHDFGFVGHEEPFQRLIHQGLITNKGAKMSKSKGNVVSPDEFVDKYGGDVFRMYLMFMGPFTEGGDWNDKGITGIARFVERFYLLMTSEEKKIEDEPLFIRNVHKLIKRMTRDIENFQFNTAIAAMMEFVNFAMKGGIDQGSKKVLSRLIAPLAPHLAEECWELVDGDLGKGGSVFDQEWPEYDEALTVDSQVTLAVQVNGKVRGQMDIAASAAEDEVFAEALKLENVAKHLEGKTLAKKIYVPGKLVSFVVK